jgi:hypothetical protein
VFEQFGERVAVNIGVAQLRNAEFASQTGGEHDDAYLSVLTGPFQSALSRMRSDASWGGSCGGRLRWMDLFWDQFTFGKKDWVEQRRIGDLSMCKTQVLPRQGSNHKPPTLHVVAPTQSDTVS